MSILSQLGRVGSSPERKPEVHTGSRFSLAVNDFNDHQLAMRSSDVRALTEVQLPPGVKMGPQKMSSPTAAAGRSALRSGTIMSPENSPGSAGRQSGAPQKRPLSAGHLKNAAESGVLKTVRRDLEESQDLMGSAQRHATTGEIILRNTRNFPDYYVVDLYRRHHLPETLLELEADPYLFKPVPLKHRTWFYHYVYNQGKVMPGIDEAGSIRWALSHQCIDAPLSAGRWSPFACFAPFVLGTTLTGDLLTVAVSILLVIVLYVTQDLANSPEHYRWTRFYSLPFRIAFFIYFVVSFKSDSILTICGSLTGIVCTVVDFAAGEVSAVLGYKFNCTYEVLKVLPSRVCICRRVGANEIEKLVGKTEKVHELVSGFGTWERSHTLVTDIKGLLVELQPMTMQDWRSMHMDYCVSLAPLPFVGLDAFGPQDDFVPYYASANIDDVEAAEFQGGEHQQRPAKCGTQMLTEGTISKIKERRMNAMKGTDSYDNANADRDQYYAMIAARSHNSGQGQQSIQSSQRHQSQLSQQSAHKADILTVEDV